MPEKQRFLTIAEAAEFLHVSETSLRRWTNSGKLPSFRIGGRSERRFLMDDLLAFMPSAESQPALSRQHAAEIQLIPESQAYQRHICLFYLNPDEQWQMLRPYILEFLTAGLPVVYVQDSAPPSRLLELLRAEGLPLEELIARERADLEPVARLTADRIYERRWALTLLEQVLTRLGEEYRASGNALLFERLRQMPKPALSIEGRDPIELPDRDWD